MSGQVGKTEVKMKIEQNEQTSIATCAPLLEDLLYLPLIRRASVH